MTKRKYTLKQRAAQQRETREKIVDAAMALHEELGPAATTISALAERAGVQRLTVYRHFASDEELFGACTSKWFALNPPPDLTAVEADDAMARAHAFLLALYRYYRRTKKMWTGAYRDVEVVPALAGPMAAFDDSLVAAAKELADELAPRPTQRLRATLGHAAAFSTWRSLAKQGLGDRAMANTVCAWLRCAGAQSG
jgi:AcrR family transcriptional regulator